MFPFYKYKFSLLLYYYLCMNVFPCCIFNYHLIESLDYASLADYCCACC
jgi:hypothetical protein